MAGNKLLAKIGLSWHDIFIVVLLFETCWWGMFAFMGSADIVIRAIEDASKTEYHTFVLIQKGTSLLKLILVISCLWYGTIYLGKGLYPRIYLVVGIFVDLVITLAWIMISTEESWPIAPTNIFGLHYIITFVILRSMAYCVLYYFTVETFASPFGPPVVGTANGTVTGIPEHGSCRTSNGGSNLAFLGKGIGATLEYYRIEVEQAFLVAVIWDVIWNWSIIFSQELPQFAFNYVFVDMMGSVALDIPTNDLILRATRIILGLGAIYLVIKKVENYVKIWICLYASVLMINVGFLCYMYTSIMIDETFMGILILCTVFFSSSFAKIFVIYCSLRFYMRLRKNNACLIHENNNEN